MMLRIAAMFAALLGGAAAQGQPAEPPPEFAAQKRIAHLMDRLGALTPDRPRAYFELGEEVASESGDDRDRRLARQLFVLAFELSRRAKQPDTQLPSSVCLALASVADTDEERRWLAALAETLAPPGSPPPDAVRIKSTAASRDPAAFDVASMLGLVRIGEGRRAEKLLARPGVERLLDKCDALLSTGGTGGASRVRKQIEEWGTCPQCHNKRFVRDSTGIHLCPTCHGAPGPTMSQQELVGHIRTESLLLSGQQRSWAGQIISDYGAPIRELDASELAGTYGVDVSRPLWRSGRWESDPKAPKPVPGPPEAKPGATPTGEAQPASKKPAATP
jgi:hypothetical protein